MKKDKLGKIHIEDITFCIPIRIESAYRSRNLYTLLKYLSKNFSTKYIILEADNKQKLSNDFKMKNLEYFFIKDNDSIFHRTKYINRMLCTAQTPYAAIWDADAIAPVAQIISAYQTLQKGAAMVYPFSGAFYDLNEQLSSLFEQETDIEKIDFPYCSKPLINGYYSVGGAFMVNIQEYNRCGAENQHFYGWGPEDAERIARMGILGKEIRRIDGPLYHMYHTRGHNSRYANMDIALETKNEFCKICGMTNTELKNYIKTWSWL